MTDGLRSAERATRLMLLVNPPTWLVRACAMAVDRIPVLPPPLGRLHSIMRTIDGLVWAVIHDRQDHPDSAGICSGCCCPLATRTAGRCR